MTELVAFVVIVAAVAAAGLVVGMLVAPRLERLTEPRDEEPGAGDDPARD
ncbi:MAG TPA: hypothetical protein VLA44_08975 [Clostridia bacterium]|nr:hypothetical protein [Clostridia bacterium]